jgi:hypothetical protein
MKIKINKPLVRSFCFCGNLRKTAVSAGYLNVIIGVSAMVATVIAMVGVGLLNYDCGDEKDCVPKFLQFSEYSSLITSDVQGSER